MRSNVIIGSVCLLVFLMLFAPGYVGAQSSLTLSVTPTLFEMSATPGQVWQSNVKVVNSNSFDLVVYPQVVNFAPQGEAGQGKFLPVFEEVTEGATLAEWVSIDPNPVVIPPETSKQIPFVVSVPEDASPGGHFAAILISTQPPEPEDRMSVKTSQIVTSLFFVRVAGDVMESGTIRTFTTADSIVPEPQATFELRFENKGNVHLQPRGEIRVFNMWGAERGVIPINERTHFGNVLPESIRKFEFKWQGEPSISDIGRYKAEASLAYGFGNKKFETASTHFWVIPLKSLMITLSIFFAIILGVSWAIRLYIKRMLQLAGVDPAYRQVRIVPDSPVVDSEDVRVGSYQSLTAPVRSGVSDLRSRLREGTAFSSYAGIFARFLLAYKKFFLALIVLGAASYATVLFFSSVTDTNKSYEVTIENPDQDLNLSSEEIIYENLAESAGTPGIGAGKLEQPFSISIVNTSGEAGTAAQVALELVEAGYRVDELRNDPTRTNKTSALVYDTELQTVAGELSRLLGILPSVRPDSGTSTAPQMTIFVGADQTRDSDTQ